MLKSFLIVFCLFYFVGYINCYEVKRNKAPLLSNRKMIPMIQRLVDDVFETEYLKFYETGIETDKWKYLKHILSPSIEIGRLEVEKMSLDDQLSLCALCNPAIKLLRKYLSNPVVGKPFIVTICSSLNLLPSHVCSGLFDLYYPTFKILLDKKNLTNSAVCGLILQGSECVIDDKSFDWQIEIDENKPELKSSKRLPDGHQQKENIRILQLTDIHYDPFYTPGALADCDEPLCCINTEKNLNNTNAGAGRWSDYRNCDVSWDLYVDSLKHIKQKHGAEIDFVYFTGDIIEHAVWKTTVEGNSKSLKDVYAELKAIFGEIPLFPIIGNHESQPLNLFAPDYIKDKTISTSWLYELLAEEWTKWLPVETKETILKGGYYTVVPREGFRIIALNNNDAYTFNFWILYDPEHLAKQLQWFHDTLLIAEEANEYVHILMHVPSGSGSTYNVWSREFRRIIERFHHIIGGIFIGHTHFDEFNLYYSQENPKYAINVAWNGGSLTPYSNVNPNYRTYKVETHSYQVVEHNTWIFNLTYANTRPYLSPSWYKEYSFVTDYKMKDLSPDSLDNLLIRFTKDHKLLHQYWEYKVKSGDPSLEKGCDQDCLLSHLCEIVITQYNDKERCDNMKFLFMKTIYFGNSGSSTFTLLTASSSKFILTLVAIILSTNFIRFKY